MTEPSCIHCGVPFIKHLGVEGTCEAKFRILDYAIALQRAIEAHCRGEVADEMACPYHAKLLNKDLLTHSRRSE